MGEPTSDLGRRLREGDAAELVDLLRRHASELDPGEARQALRNPFLGTEAIEIMAAQRRLLVANEVRGMLARHPQTPEALALRLVTSLFWRDLLEIGLDTRVRPTVRRAADRALLARLPGLASGEKIAIARRGSTRMLQRLRHDPSPMVIRALLTNPRLTEGVVLPMVTSEEASSATLQAVARDRRWGNRHEVRLALCRNSHTPPAVALSVLPYLRKLELRQISRESRVPQLVRRRARVLLGEG